MSGEYRQVAVVIPFYQKEKGILSRALRSVFAQRIDQDVKVTVLVVDDASPVSAEEELRGVAAPDRFELRVVRQQNAGPGGARNTALDLLDPAGTQYVAFLDSDDEWEADHLATALSALTFGHDFYFCDHVRDGGDSCFSESRVMRAWRDGIRQPAPASTGLSDDLASLPAKAMFDVFLEEYLSQTSTVVYRFDRHSRVRFDDSLRHAGEDHMFWLTLLDECDSVVFSTNTNVRCGRGVNIFYSAVDWKNPRSAARAGYLMVYRLKLRRFRLSPAQTSRVEAMIGEDKRIYAWLLFRNSLKGRLPDRHALAQVIRTSYRDAAALPFALVAMLLGGRRRMTGA